MAGPIQERNQDATVYCGNLDEKVSEPLLWELFLQAGPVVNVHMPKDRITQAHQGYGFVEFMGEEDADYAIKIMNMIKVYGKPIRVNKASAHNKNLDVGANVFIGNLDPEIDEKLLYDTFSAFGVILQTPKIMRDPETGNSKGFAFINFASFAASDAAIEAMNGQYLSNRPISVSYAFKKDSKGERHGSAAERLLAAQNPLTQTDRPHQLFADAPPVPPSGIEMHQQQIPGLPVPPGPPVAGIHPASMPPPMHPPGMPPHGMMHPPPGMPHIPPSSQPPFMPPPMPPSSSSAGDFPPGIGAPPSTSGPTGQQPPGLLPPRSLLGSGHLPPPMPPPGIPPQGQIEGGPNEGSSMPPKPPPFNQRGFPPPPPGFPAVPPSSAANFGMPPQFFGGPPHLGHFGEAGGPPGSMPSGPPRGMMPQMSQGPPFAGFRGAPQQRPEHDGQFDPRGAARMRMPMDQRGGRPRMMQPPRPPPRN